MNEQGVKETEQGKKVREDMERIFTEFPDKFTPELKRGFAEKRVVVGMDPYLAHVTAGAFTYRVDADPLKWPAHADPMKVMWAQAMHPDNSKIWMTFENDTQFPGQGKVKFTVYIENGKVTEIKKI